MVLVLGIDPSLRNTGVAVVEIGNKIVLKMVNHLEMNKKLPEKRVLGKLFTSVGEILDEFSPDLVAMESIIYMQNTKTQTIMGSVRGAILAAIGLRDFDVIELSPCFVKRTVCFRGLATKEEVQRAVKRRIGYDSDFTLDESDAIAIAIAGASTVLRKTVQ
jgi:crossover junction endodeoxyribonuclease RuvC